MALVPKRPAGLLSVLFTNVGYKNHHACPGNCSVQRPPITQGVDKFGVTQNVLSIGG